MPMGATGMADMGAMEMPLPDNTLPMMTGAAQFGPIEMGGMFTVFKVREGLKSNDYKDPGWYQHPKGTIAYEANEPLQKSPRSGGEMVPQKSAAELQTVKPARSKRAGDH